MRRDTPRIVVEVELEGPASARVEGCLLNGEITRLITDLQGRDLMGEIFDAIRQLRDALKSEGVL